MTKKKELPMTIFAVRHKEDNNVWLVADTDITDFEDGDPVGQYKLVGHGTKTTKHDLEITNATI